MRAHRLYGPGPGRPRPLRPVADLAGIPVDDADGRYAGTAHGALADAASGLIRFIDVALHDADRHTLVPIGHARIEEDWDGSPRFRLAAATRQDLRDIPPYRPDGPPPDHERARAFTDAAGRIFHGERYYAHPAYDHRGLYAGPHPIVREPPTSHAGKALVPLGTLAGYRIARGEPDIRNWPILTDDHHAATILDLIIDPGAGKVRYAHARRTRDGRTTLLPVGYLRVRPRARIVEAPDLHEADILALPTYVGGPIRRSLEDRIRRTLDRRLDRDGRHFQRPDYHHRA